jgi:hypothetical protein
MVKRFVVSLIVLCIGALLSTFVALIATNGYGTAGVNENLVAAGYLFLGAGFVLLLAWLSALLSSKLTARLGWHAWITLPLVLLPALMSEFIALPLLAVVLAELGR